MNKEGAEFFFTTFPTCHPNTTNVLSVSQMREDFGLHKGGATFTVINSVPRDVLFCEHACHFTDAFRPHKKWRVFLQCEQ